MSAPLPLGPGLASRAFERMVSRHCAYAVLDRRRLLFGAPAGVYPKRSLEACFEQARALGVRSPRPGPGARLLVLGPRGPAWVSFDELARLVAPRPRRAAPKGAAA